MCVVGPVTVGIITSMVIAFTLSASDKYITHIQCCLLGIFQTILLIAVSFSRLLGTL